MKEKIYGFLEYDAKKYSFICEEGILTLLPNDFKESQINMWSALQEVESNAKMKKWVENITVDGVTSNGKGIKIFVSNLPRIEQGFFFFDIDYIYIYNPDYENNQDMYPIYGVGFKGKECNYFYDVAKHTNTIFQIEKNKIKKLKTELTNMVDTNLGKFKWRNYTVRVKGSFAWFKGNDTYSPLIINSILIFELSRACYDMEKLLELIQIQTNFLMYVTYRENIKFDEVYVYTITNEGLRERCGEFKFFNGREGEKDIKKLKQIINSACFEGHIGDLYEQIYKNHIYLQHIPANVSERKKYSQSRILSILIAFENSYDYIYKAERKISAESEMAKKQIIEFLDDRISNSSGKIKKKFKDIKRSMNKLNLGYEDMLKYVLEDNYDILIPFIEKIYRVKDTRKIISSCAKRCADMRNKMAHGSMNIKFKPINLMDIRLLELLIYLMQLKMIGLEKITIQQGIDILFGFDLRLESQ